MNLLAIAALYSTQQNPIQLDNLVVTPTEVTYVSSPRAIASNVTEFAVSPDRSKLAYLSLENDPDMKGSTTSILSINITDRNFKTIRAITSKKTAPLPISSPENFGFYELDWISNDTLLIAANKEFFGAQGLDAHIYLLKSTGSVVSTDFPYHNRKTDIFISPNHGAVFCNLTSASLGAIDKDGRTVLAPQVIDRIPRQVLPNGNILLIEGLWTDSIPKYFEINLKTGTLFPSTEPSDNWTGYSGFAIGGQGNFCVYKDGQVISTRSATVPIQGKITDWQNMSNSLVARYTTGLLISYPHQTVPLQDFKKRESEVSDFVQMEIAMNELRGQISSPDDLTQAFSSLAKSEPYREIMKTFRIDSTNPITISSSKHGYTYRLIISNASGESRMFWSKN